ncbi:MAG: CoA-binding protein [Chloroflexi bacterium]|nr:CoA-binding protein [Chloroflexota bacterium]
MTNSNPKNRQERLDRVFNPQTVVVVGSKKIDEYNWLKNMSTFTGKLYSVQIDPNEIPGIEELGITNFKSLKEVPEPIDFVLCAVPRPVTPRIVQDCIDVGVGGVVLYTSGFAETATEDGIRLQEAITKMAREADLMLVGPNCMGIYNPKVGVRFGQDQVAGVSGHVSFISQSGSQGSGFGLECQAQGLNVCKVVSFGNGVVLDSPDYLEYFAQDPECQVITMYVEGTRDGRRFFKTLRDVAQRKPVLVWKGGQTPDSARATRSHTASLAVSSTIWDALIRQTGAIPVHGLEETVDMAKALLFTKPFTGARLGLLAVAGGHSVEIADAFSMQGLNVPALTEASYEKLASFFSVIGGSFRNPLEGGGNMASEEKVIDILRILEEDATIDAIVVEMGMFGRRNLNVLERRVKTLVEFKQITTKPLWSCWSGGVTRVDPEAQQKAALELQEGGVPVFGSITRAARAMGKFVRYSRWLQEQ